MEKTKTLFFVFAWFLLLSSVFAEEEKIFVEILDNNTILAYGYGIVGRQYVDLINNSGEIKFLVSTAKNNCSTTTTIIYNTTIFYNLSAATTSEILRNISLLFDEFENSTTLKNSNISQEFLRAELKTMKENLYNDLLTLIDEGFGKISESVREKEKAIEQLSKNEEKVNNLETELKILNISHSSQIDSRDREIKILNENLSLLKHLNNTYSIILFIFLVLFLLNFGLIDKIKVWMHGISYRAPK